MKGVSSTCYVSSTSFVFCSFRCQDQAIHAQSCFPTDYVTAFLGLGSTPARERQRRSVEPGIGVCKHEPFRPTTFSMLGNQLPDIHDPHEVP